MLGYNRTIARTNINVLINIGPGVGGGRKRRGKKGNLPNTFDDDCSFVSKSVLENPAMKVKVATEIRRHIAGAEAVVFRPFSERLL